MALDHHNHDHPHGHDPHGHAHHDHDHGAIALSVIEEPLDPANQSLADALRLSFGVLKLVMLLLVALFMLSGLVCVDQSEVVVLSRFGKLHGAPREPGLHFAWPYPIDEQIPVSTSLRTLTVDKFWLRIPDVDKDKSLSMLAARGPGLDPAADGALLTGDRAIMHVEFNVQYRVNNEVRVRAGETEPARQMSDVLLFVQNVDDEKELVTSVIQNAAIAEAVRTTADVLLKNPGLLASLVQKRAQTVLDRMQTGITLDKVAAPLSYFPLQARDEFIGVSNAEQRRNELINEAAIERDKKLKGMAGAAWESLSKDIDLIDQAQSDEERQQTIQRIEDTVGDAAQTTGEAAGLIKLAESKREQIVAQTKAETSRFEAFLEEYRKSPDLVRQQLRTEMLSQLFDKNSVVKWWLPAGQKQLIFTLNKDPLEIRQAEQERLKKKAEGM